jgi:hypothetical protein
LKIPKTIKIGGHTIKVRVFRKPVEEGNRTYAGLACHNDNEIRIATHYGDNGRASETNIEETFCHEIVHSICEKYGVPMNEGRVKTFSAGLYQVLKDNRLDFSK